MTALTRLVRNRYNNCDGVSDSTSCVENQLVILQTELALQLCWAIGEHGGGGASHKDEARELFESLELLLYENLSTRYGQ